MSNKKIMKTLTRYIPQGSVEYKPEIGEYPKDLLTVYINFDRNSAIAYKGKSNKHLWYNRFNSESEMKDKIAKTAKQLMDWEDLKAERKEKRKAPTNLKVGDILYSSWGYDQTNVNFYKIVETKGKRMVVVREVGSKIVSSDGGASTHVVAVPDRFVSDKVYNRLATNDRVNVTDCQTAWLWDGRPVYETASGWGH